MTFETCLLFMLYVDYGINNNKHTVLQNAKCTFIIYYYICFPLCAHILYFDEAKFSIKLFSLVYFTVSVVRQRNEYEIVTET